MSPTWTNDNKENSRLFAVQLPAHKKIALHVFGFQPRNFY